MDEFLIRALLAGTGVALIAGPLGCFIVWRRMAYFGAALSHSALLGVALGILIGIEPIYTVAVFCVVLALAIFKLQRYRMLATDTLLSILAHGALALGLVVVAFMEQVRMDLMAYLFGDILAVGWADVALMFAVAVVVLAWLAYTWRDLIAATVNRDLAIVEGIAVERIELGFVVVVAAVIALGMKAVGVLLVVSLLTIPAAAARAWSATPERMAVGAVAVGVVSSGLGVMGSYWWDAPAGPMIVIWTCIFFVAGLLGARLKSPR